MERIEAYKIRRKCGVCRNPFVASDMRQIYCEKHRWRDRHTGSDTPLILKPIRKVGAIVGR